MPEEMGMEWMNLLRGATGRKANKPRCNPESQELFRLSKEN